MAESSEKDGLGYSHHMPWVAMICQCAPVGMAKPRTCYAKHWLGCGWSVVRKAKQAVRGRQGSVLQKHTCFTLRHSCCTLWCLPEEVENR